MRTKFRRHARLSPVALREIAVREAAPDPEGSHRLVVRIDIQDIERIEGHELDPTCERLARLLQQLHRGGPQDEESPGSPAGPATLVDEPTELGKEFGGPVDLIQDH